MKTNGQHEVIARIAGTGLVLATLLALVLASSIAGRAQSSAASPAVPAGSSGNARKGLTGRPGRATDGASSAAAWGKPRGHHGALATGSSRSGTPTASLSPTRSLRTACHSERYS